MVNLIRKCIASEKMRYLFAGGCTTLVNLISFFLLRTFTEIGRNTCNVIAIILAITFAYFINSFFVFKSEARGIFGRVKEMVLFVSFRLMSMLVEVLGLAILCDSFRIREVFSKIAVQFIVLVLNYLFSKLIIFKKEKRSLKEHVLDNYCYYISFAIVFICMVADVAVQGIAPFGDRSMSIVDSLHQYLPFFSEYRDKLLNEGSLFYSWNIAMGTNFMALGSYYLSSPFNLLLLLFNKENIVVGYTIITIVKISLSAVTMAHLLSYKDGKKKRNFCIIGISVAYALSNYVVGYYWNIMWLDCLLIFPLIILGFKRLMEKGDAKLYALSLCYALFCNYYIGFIICVFLILWFIVYNHKTIKKFFFDGIKFAVFSIISAGMAAFLLLPAYNGIMLTASAKTPFPKWSWYGDIFVMLKQHLMFTEPITNQTFDGGVNLYCSMLAVFAFFLYITSTKIKLMDKLRYTLLLAVLMISFNSVPLNFIWHGFHDQYGIPNRFSFLYIFVILLMTYDVLRKADKLRALQVIAAGLLGTAFVFLCDKYQNVPFKIFAASIIAIMIYTAVCFLRSVGICKNKLFHIIITGFLLVEVCTNAIVGFLDNGYAAYMNYYESTPQMTLANERIAEMAKEQDAGFYRSELMKYTVLDEASWHNMPSVSTFCSTVLGEMTTLMGRLGFYTGANEFLYKGATPFTNSIFNIRYLLYRDGDLNNFMFDYVENVEDIGIYENPYPLSIGFAVNKDVKEWQRDDALPINNQNAFATAMTGELGMFRNEYPELYASSDDVNLTVDGSIVRYEPYKAGKAKILISFTADFDGDYYINCRGNYVTKLKIFINGEEMAYDRYQIQIFHLGDLKAGDYVSIEYNYDNLKMGSENASVYVATFDKELYDKVYSVLSQNLLYVDEYKDGYIKGVIDMPKGKTLFTSVPYDKGWNVYIDGEKQDYYAIGEALIGIDVPAGIHKVEMKYTPTGLLPGILISILSWGMLLYYELSNVQKKKEKTSKINGNEIDHDINI